MLFKPQLAYRLFDAVHVNFGCFVANNAAIATSLILVEPLTASVTRLRTSFVSNEAARSSVSRRVSSPRFRVIAVFFGMQSLWLCQCFFTLH
jgi:hypothetical protein